jgi:hypothetical protein
MQNSISAHSFHIPVMGLGYTVDTPVKVAQYGISSVVSIMDDQLLDVMRKIYAQKWNLPYSEIPSKIEDSRAKRVTSYLNLLQQIIELQLKQMQESDLEPGSPLSIYLDLLPSESLLTLLYQTLKSAPQDQYDYILKQIKDYL